MLIRDRPSGKPLFETHALSEGFSRADGALIGAMFQAALTDFPKVAEKPHRVDVILAPETRP
jgi:hypothetical protein